MALLGKRAEAQGRWFPAHVGALTDSPRSYIEGTDQIVEDLDIPIMQQALDLQKGVFAIADELGIRAEVETAIYALRSAAYASVPFGGPAAATAVAAAGVSGLGLGAVAGLGAIGVVAVIAFALFGGGDDEAAQKRVKAAQARVLHLRDRLTLSEFATEQESVAAGEQTSAQLAAIFPGFGTPASHYQAASRASKLATFYRAADKRLSSGERALFETLSNLGRWQATLTEYEKLPQSKKDGLDVMFGKTEPRLPYQLKGPMVAEATKLPSLVEGAKPAAMKGGGGLGTVVLIGSAGALFYFFSPALALGAAAGIWGAAKRGANYVTGKIKGVGTP